MNIVSRARAEKPSLQTQRVFLYCAPENVSDREKLVEDLLSNDAGIDCMVQYVDPPDAPRDETKLENEMTGTKALVLWVTPDLLSAIRDKKIPVEYTLAQKLKLPVLPIATFPELLPEFSRLVAPVHAIARSDGEYRAKLRAQLERLLVTKEQMEAILKKAFIAKLFVSYRKMDIAEARRFIKMLHDVDGFEAVSVWYDHFLTLGEKFDDEIEAYIKNTDAFALVVTPNLLKPNDEGKPNYVQSTEYPSARKKGKPVIPVEALPTKFEDFAKLFEGLDKTIPLENKTALRDAFRAKLGDALTPQPLDSERAYHLGMAYLKGYGVEYDFDRAVGLLEKTTDAFSETALRAAKQLADIYENGAGTDIDYREALQWYKKAADISEHIFGEEHPIVAAIYNNIGNVYRERGNCPLALEWLQKALAVQEKVLGMEHPDTASSYNNIGGVCHTQGDYSQALMWYQKALAIVEKVLGVEHPDTAASYNNIGNVYRVKGDYSQALVWHQKALAVKEKVLGVKHRDTAMSYNNIGNVFRAQGDYPQALVQHQKALAIRQKILGEEHPDTAASHNNIGNVYHAQGNDVLAQACYQQALAVRQKILGEEHPDTAASCNNIGETCRVPDEALAWHQQALAVRQKIQGEEHPDTAISYYNIGVCYQKQGKDNYPQALTYYLKALTIQEKKMLGMESPDIANTYSNIGVICHERGDYLQALQWYGKALTIQQKVFGLEDSKTAVSYNNIGNVYRAKGDYSQALDLLFKAFQIWNYSLGMEHPYTKSAVKFMKKTFIANGGRESDFLKCLNESMEKKSVAPLLKTKGFLGGLLSRWRRS